MSEIRLPDGTPSMVEILRDSATESEGHFRAWDTMAVELEVAEFLHALVRLTKPAHVVECGTGNGYASVFIADALAENGFGDLITYEQDRAYAMRAAERLIGLPARVRDGYSHEWPRDSVDPDLVFIDSLGGEPRERDMDWWFACKSRPLIVIHDAAHYPLETFTDRGEGVLVAAGRGLWIGRSR